MPHPSTPRLLALHELRVRHLVDREDIELEKLGADGLARRRGGQVSGWMLTPEGRAAHVEEVAAELEASGGRDAIADAYGRFLRVNPDLLLVCTDWQLRNGAVNDHKDAAYDAAVLSRLETVHERIRPVLDDLASVLERFGAYGPRLQNALDRIRSGEYEWFTRPLLDSYHTVWFELHEDLLGTLGLSRGDEGRGAR